MIFCLTLARRYWGKYPNIIKMSFPILKIILIYVHMPSDNFTKVIKDINRVGNKYEKLFQKASDTVVFHNVTKLITY